MARRRRVRPEKGATDSSRAPTAATGRPRRSVLVVGAIGLVVAGVLVGVVAGSLGNAARPSASTDLGPPGTLGPPASVIPAPGVPTADPQGNYRAIGSITCDSLEHTTYHIHAHLELRFGGEVHGVPADIGIRDTCLYWLHTHRDSGIIHVEAPAERTFTLGEFFDVWGEVLTDRQVLDRALEPTETLFVFVNGERYEGDAGGLEFGDLEAIELQVGTAPFQPLRYTFPSDLE